jgi:hypothetical protein
MATIRNKSKIAAVKAKIENLESSLERNVQDEVEDQAEKLVDDIERTIESMGLVGDPSDKPGQIALKDSFITVGGGEKIVVTSTAPHAAAIEEGASNHPIMPDGDNLLSFVPENPSEYPQASGDEYVPFGTWYDPEEGVVFSTGIEDHPGNKPYNYMLPAQRKWWPFASSQIRGSVKSSIVSAGFKPAASGGLDRGPDYI